jgi:hypothetical protein
VLDGAQQVRHLRAQHCAVDGVHGALPVFRRMRLYAEAPDLEELSGAGPDGAERHVQRQNNSVYQPCFELNNKNDERDE